LSEARPEPMVPPEVDLRDFAFMPLDVLRLRDSDLSAVATGEEFKAAVLLWCAAWHQVPAASVPNDDRWLARHSGAGPGWRKVRTEALRGFVECSDGRLYHEIVAEKAIQSWQAKLAQRAKTRNATEARKQRDDQRDVDKSERHDQRDDQRHVNVTSTSRPSESDRDVHQGTGTVKGQGSKGTGTGTELQTQPQSQPRLPDAARSVARKRRGNGEDYNPKTSETWEAYRSAYLNRYGTDPVRNAMVNAQIANFVNRIGAKEAPRVAEFYLSHSKAFYVAKKHSAGLLLADAEGLRTEWATGRQVTDTEARQADRTAATGNVFKQLIEEAGHE
jgi:hypothetical protein